MLFVLLKIKIDEEDLAYFVGSPVNAQQKIQKATYLRRFYLYPQSTEKLDLTLILKTLSVQFVRNKRYTVYPYFFDFIRMWRQDILLDS